MHTGLRSRNRQCDVGSAEDPEPLEFSRSAETARPTAAEAPRSERAAATRRTTRAGIATDADMRATATATPASATPPRETAIVCPRESIMRRAYPNGFPQGANLGPQAATTAGTDAGHLTMAGSLGRGLSLMRPIHQHVQIKGRRHEVADGSGSGRRTMPWPSTPGELPPRFRPGTQAAL